MPELPEVETIRRTLTPHLVGQVVTNVRVFRPAQVRNVGPEELAWRLCGLRIEKLGRRGKYLLMYLGADEVLVIHLRMTGRLIYYEEGSGLTPYTRLVLTLTPPAELHLHDVRSFAMVFLVKKDELDTLPGLAALGPEPFDLEFTPGKLAAGLTGHKSPVKNVLLGQRAVAGLGNIYADESLFRAGINPLCPADTLKGEEIRRLWRAVREVLAEAISAGGTSIRDYVDGRGVPGSFQVQLMVYGRKGRPCPRCGTPLQGQRLSGRSTVYCPRCQPLWHSEPKGGLS